MKLKCFMAAVSAKVALTVRKTAKENILRVIKKYAKILLNQKNLRRQKHLKILEFWEIRR